MCDQMGEGNVLMSGGVLALWEISSGLLTRFAGVGFASTVVGSDGFAGVGSVAQVGWWV